MAPNIDVTTDASASAMLDACREALALLRNPDADVFEATRVESLLAAAIGESTDGPATRGSARITGMVRT